MARGVIKSTANSILRLTFPISATLRHLKRFCDKFTLFIWVINVDSRPRLFCTCHTWSLNRRFMLRRVLFLLANKAEIWITGIVKNIYIINITNTTSPHVTVLLPLQRTKSWVKWITESAHMNNSWRVGSKEASWGGRVACTLMLKSDTWRALRTANGDTEDYGGVSCPPSGPDRPQKSWTCPDQHTVCDTRIQIFTWFKLARMNGTAGICNYCRNTIREKVNAFLTVFVRLNGNSTSVWD